VAIEVERKFLVEGSAWRDAAGAGTRLRQGYLSTDKARVVRVRTENTRGTVTIKGQTRGVSRLEFEYVIPYVDATRLLDELCLRPLLEKTRYRIPVGGLTWEVDEFHGDNDGLVVAEVELADPAQAIVRPEWCGAEVSGDPRYFNSNLIARPYRTWLAS
jgi:adenylate cyclase